MTRVGSVTERLRYRLGDGPSAQAVLAYPWEKTALGPIEAWPEQLLLLVQVMLTSEFPMMLAWGREYVQLYNDAFRPILGSGKHPGALGASARDTWGEIWDEVGPLFSTVFDDGVAVRNVDQRLLPDRNGYVEEAFFTYSYSPIRDRTDQVAGMLVIAYETTAQVVDRRRLGSIVTLASALVGSTSIESVATATVSSLRNCADLTAVEIDLIVAERPVQIANMGTPVISTSEREELRTAVDADDLVVLDAEWRAGLPARRVAFRIDGPDLRIILVVGLNPERAFDEDYQNYVRLLRQTVAASMTAALLRVEELGALRNISDTLQHAMLEVASDLPTVAARYIPKSNWLTVGGDWYDVLDLGHGRRALIVGDCVGHGLTAATAMGALRNVSRALFLEGRTPVEVVNSLHGFATTMDAAFCATVVCAIVDLEAQAIAYCNAGHPPPLLVSAGCPVWLNEALGPPLGVAEPIRVEGSVTVEPGDLLVLYTDGLIERRGELMDRGLERLADSATACASGSVQEIADSLIDQLLDGPPGDDVALVVKRIH